jgi:Holliday junction DNA helicase RuvA
MIASLTGELRRVEDDRVHLQCGPIVYELLVPAADMTELQASLGETITFHTIFYMAGDPTRGGLEPTLIGFLRPDDKKFFELFTTVKGIGPKRALRALAVSVGQIASAIEGKDTRFLIQLPEIGKRTAEQIVAELAGKLKTFAAAGMIEAKAGVALVSRRNAIEEDAIAGLMALGERRPDAENLLERAKQSNPELKTADQLLREMLRMRTVRAS